MNKFFQDEYKRKLEHCIKCCETRKTVGEYAPQYSKWCFEVGVITIEEYGAVKSRLDNILEQEMPEFKFDGLHYFDKGRMSRIKNQMHAHPPGRYALYWFIWNLDPSLLSPGVNPDELITIQGYQPVVLCGANMLGDGI